ncbi:MAG: MaoC family dehydratase [Betaproteobacteria bacterium]
MIDVRIGDAFDKEVLIDAASIRTFATLAGDMNPLHHDDEAAAQGPYGALIASGPQLVSLMLGVDATHFSAAGVTVGLGFDFKFVRAVPAGTRLVLAWTVTGCDYKPSLAGWIVTVDGVARDAAGALYVSARGSNLVRERAATPERRAAS